MQTAYPHLRDLDLHNSICLIKSSKVALQNREIFCALIELGLASNYLVLLQSLSETHRTKIFFRISDSHDGAEHENRELKIINGCTLRNLLLNSQYFGWNRCELCSILLLHVYFSMKKNYLGPTV